MSLPPLRFRKKYRANFSFSLPSAEKEGEDATVTKYLKGDLRVSSGGRDQLKLQIVDSLTEEEKEKGIFHIMEYDTGKKSVKPKTFVVIHCLNFRLEVQGTQLDFLPDPEPEGPKCNSETPCRAVFERRRHDGVSQLICTSTTELSRKMAIGLQKKGLISKSWKPGLVPAERAVANRHVIDLLIDIPKPKDQPKSMSFLSVPT